MGTTDPTRLDLATLREQVAEMSAAMSSLTVAVTDMAAPPALPEA